MRPPAVSGITESTVAPLYSVPFAEPRSWSKYSSPSRRTSACTREAKGSGIHKSFLAERPMVIRRRPNGKWSGARSGYLTISSDIFVDYERHLAQRPAGLERTLTNNNGASNDIVQTATAHGQRRHYEPHAKHNKRQWITHKVPQQSTTYT